MTDDDCEISIEGLSKSFIEGDQRHHVLRNLAMQVSKGESIALRGRSGSGKSTLLNMISGIDLPDDGQIVVTGANITSMRERERTIFRRNHIGFIYQAFNLVPTLTVGDNIRLVLELNGVDRQETNTRVTALLQSVELGERESSYPDLLSGGEQQRVAIARALANRPAILLADEPTGNLDDKTAEGVLAVLENLRKQTGGTMIIATHSDRIASRCDRVLELQDGSFVAGHGG